MSALFQNYGRRPVHFVKGSGSYVWDDRGDRFLDFTSGIAVLALGHCHPKLVQTIQAQSEKLWHTSNLFTSTEQEQLAADLVEETHLSHAFFCNSGTEANEAAIKLARKYTKKHKMITFNNSFHGRTFGAMSATGQEKVHSDFGPIVDTFEYLPFNEPQILQHAIDDETGAIMLEMIQGEGGVNAITDEFAEMIQSICDEKGILLIIDEVQTGIARTGTKYAFEQTVLKPHIVTLAKGLGGGFPIGAMLGTAELFEAFGPGTHGSTFGGNPLAVAVAQTVIDLTFNEAFLKNVNEKSAYFQKQLALHLLKSDVKGWGLLLGISVDQPLAQVVDACEKQGLLVVGAGETTLRLLPPLNVTNAEIDEAVTILAKVLN
ncbi:acetylornithine aminotransferase [Kurthia zopfii]|uniref:Acetylornithine aminotransferase n=1 Tax=Kurthia zopfii TaxID=1650 RepID=A0A8B4QA58_9BACL|nr:acetylornithine transaminase [Kurthia zopfii]PWI22591.1 acetylornithine transaminase [Kurthia zopfii]TDR39049.1 acetylornithine aminotransferase [Kurthia zopfii]GEK31272.1 acetylornithine aminotransferase [Kurthia zopfii]STX09585.1 Acetylornithine aminotransferase [Kurthia zopfii]